MEQNLLQRLTKLDKEMSRNGFTDVVSGFSTDRGISELNETLRVYNPSQVFYFCEKDREGFQFRVYIPVTDFNKKKE